MIKLIALGKIKDKHLKALIDDYQKRINRYHKLTVIELKDETISDNDSREHIIDKEGDKILKEINDDEFVIALDLAGKKLDSLQFAAFIDRQLIIKPRLTFVIGGSLGLSDKVIKRAGYRFSLSDLTFLHQMTRLIILEQIYRAFKILNNETYHK